MTIFSAYLYLLKSYPKELFGFSFIMNIFLINLVIIVHNLIPKLNRFTLKIKNFYWTIFCCVFYVLYFIIYLLIIRYLTLSNKLNLYKIWEFLLIFLNNTQLLPILISLLFSIICLWVLLIQSIYYLRMQWKKLYIYIKNVGRSANVEMFYHKICYKFIRIYEPFFRRKLSYVIYELKLEIIIGHILTKFNVYIKYRDYLDSTTKYVKIFLFLFLIMIFLIDIFFNNFCLYYIYYYLFFYLIIKTWLEISKSIHNLDNILITLLWELNYKYPQILYVNISNMEEKILQYGRKNNFKNHFFFTKTGVVEITYCTNRRFIRGLGKDVSLKIPPNIIIYKHQELSFFPSGDDLPLFFEESKIKKIYGKFFVKNPFEPDAMKHYKKLKRIKKNKKYKFF